MGKIVFEIIFFGGVSTFFVMMGSTYYRNPDNVAFGAMKEYSQLIDETEEQKELRHRRSRRSGLIALGASTVPIFGFLVSCINLVAYLIG